LSQVAAFHFTPVEVLMNFSVSLSLSILSRRLANPTRQDFILLPYKIGDCGGTVVKVLCYKSEGRWFDPSWCHWNFSWTSNPSDRTMALGSTQPLKEMSTRSISWGKGGRCLRMTTLPPSCAVVMKYGTLNFLGPSGPLQACNGTALPLLYRTK
jgi:hypothetical protein